MFLGIIGKFGLFPLNLGIFGVVDGVSLFTSMVVLGLNKFIYLVIIWPDSGLMKILFLISDFPWKLIPRKIYTRRNITLN